jgi:PAS domain S-box-containing protein
VAAMREKSTSEVSARRFRFLRMYCQCSAVATVGLACLVLYGWAFNIPALKSVFPGLVTMKANTALGLGLSGISLWLLLFRGSGAGSGSRKGLVAPFLALIFALTVVFIGAATLSEYLFGVNLRIDELLFKDPLGSTGTTSPGRLAPATALAFISIGVALLLLDWKTLRNRSPAQGFSLFATLIGMLAISGYVYHAFVLTRIFVYTQVALHTAIAIFFLSFAVFFARPHHGIAGDFTGEGSGIVMARRFLPAVFFIPVFLGWILLQGQFAGLYGMEVGLAINATSSIVVFGFLVWLSARQMNREHEERRQVEEVRGRMAAVVDSSDDAIISKDLEGVITAWNRGAQKVFGHSAAEAVGQSMRILIPAERAGEEPDILARIARGESVEHFETVRLRKDGRRIDISATISPIRDGSGVIVGASKIARDISKSKADEREIRRLNEELEKRVIERTAQLEAANKELNTLAAAVESSDDAIVTKTLEGTITAWNSGAQRLFGYSAAEAMGQSMRMLLPAERENEEAEILARIGRGELVDHFETVRLRKDGARIDVSVTISPLKDENGAIIGASNIARNISHRKQTEAALEQALGDRIRFQDEFLSHVSHELRTPLTAIKQFTSIFLGGLAGNLSPEQIRYQKIILKNVLQLQAMIDDLLEVTRLENGKLSVELESVEVSDAVSDSINTLQPTAVSKGVTLSGSVAANLPSAYADSTRLRQVLIILLDNALKFTPAGGTVEVSARLLPKDSGRLLLEVSDSGCGMNAEASERIFGRHFQVTGQRHNSRKGLGLGLFICKELVTRQGGQIWVTSEPQRGSVFSFTLPIFSLSRLIAPMFSDHRWPAESVALVAIGTRLPRAGLSPQSQEERSREVRGTVDRCLMPNLDVLLPKSSCGAKGDWVFVVAFANEKGASILAKRMREQLERLAECEETFSVSYTMLGLQPPDIGMTPENVAESLAAKLEELMESQDIQSQEMKSQNAEAAYHE